MVETTDLTVDFSKNLSKEQIRSWLAGMAPEDVNDAIINALKASNPNDKLDYLTSMSLIAEVEKDKEYRGDTDFLKIVLGQDTYKEMAITGHVTAGFYKTEENTISDTFTVTQRYTKWSKLLNLKMRTAIGKFF
jgi:hypothetical protein